MAPKTAVLIGIALFWATSAGAQTAADRGRFATRLQRVFLETGISVAVGRREKSGRFAKHVPQLFVLGPFTKAMVFNLLQDGRLLERMQKVGFRELDLINNIGTQSLVFKLDGPELPHCNTTHYVCW